MIGPLIARDAQALLQHGVETTASVEQLIQHGSGAATRHRVLLAVTDNAAIRLNTAVTPEQAAALKQGQRLTVTYLPGSKPVVVLGDIDEVRTLGSRGRMAMIVGGVLLAIGAALALWMFGAARRTRLTAADGLE